MPVGHHSRQRGRLARLIAEDRQGEREDLDSDQVEQEIGHGVDGELQAGGNVVAKPVTRDRLVDPQWDSDQYGQQQGRSREVKAARPPLRNKCRDGLVQFVGVAEIAVNQRR